jgi:hypothetical protein
MANGALSVAFPTREVNIPAMTLMAVTLSRNPASLRMSAPQVAVRRAYREAHRLLSQAAGTSRGDAQRRQAIKEAFGDKALDFFLVAGQLHQPTIDVVLRALLSDGPRMLPLVNRRRSSEGDAVALNVPRIPEESLRDPRRG